ncbi:MAG: hypothetical protein U1E38_10755 [Rhodospirillales bacterium]
MLEDAAEWLAAAGARAGQATAALRLAAAHLRALIATCAAGVTGERNELSVRPLGIVVASMPAPTTAMPVRVAAALAGGNAVVTWRRAAADDAFAAALAAAGPPGGDAGALPPGVNASSTCLPTASAGGGGDGGAGRRARRGEPRPGAARRRYPAADPWRDRTAAVGGIGALLAGTAAWLERFVHERTLTVDTTASGGNAALLSLDEDA